MVAAEKNLKELRTLASEKQLENKCKLHDNLDLKNLELSLAASIRESSRSLRNQEKEYFNTIRSYEKSTGNSAIELTQEQKKMMMREEEWGRTGLLEEQKNDSRNEQINELVSSINKLSGIYKELNQLVIEQGSLIDRIDVNIELTLEHTSKAVGHLEECEKAVDSPFADRMIKGLVMAIVLCAIILGLKYMN